MRIRTAHITGDAVQLTQVLREAIAELEQHGETNVPIEPNGDAPALLLAFVTENTDDDDGKPLVEWSEVEQ